MKLSKLQEIIAETLKQGREDTEYALATNPDIIFCFGKPTENKHLRISGVGVAGNLDEEPIMFLEMRPANNPIADLHSIIKELLGEERASELITGVQDSLVNKESKAETETETKVDA